MKRKLADCLVEVTNGVGADWHKYRVLGATREGLALAKEPVGKSPQRYKLVVPGTVFYNPMRIMIGSIAMLDDGEEPGITSPDYVVLRTQEGILHHRWFYYWLRSAFGQELTKSLARGAVRERMMFARLGNGEITLPSWDDQLRAAEQLAELVHARVAMKSQLDIARSFPASCLRHFYGSEMGKKWPDRRLGEVLRPRIEVVHPQDKPKGEATFVGLEHIEPHTGRQLGAARIEMAALTGRKPRFRTGDIVYGYLRPYLNKVWVAQFDGLCSVDQYVYEVRQDIADVDFVAWFMRSPTYLVRAPIDTIPGQLPRIRTEEVAQVSINLPPLQEQERIAQRIGAVFQEFFRLSEALVEKLGALERLPMAILSREAWDR